jgi:predicted component of viral defense system (DUF524 family)
LLDAKFRLVGSLANDEPPHARPDDIHKMHAYRDAIPEARFAWVLFPGKRAHWWRHPKEGAGVQGVGAIPLAPGEDHTALVELVGAMLGITSGQGFEKLAAT